MQDLATKLVDYVENKLDPETEMAIDDLIVRYVDGSLDSDVAAEIERVMATHPAVADYIAEDIRAAKAINEHLLPAYDALDVPPTPKADQALADMIADAELENEKGHDETEADIVPFQTKPSPQRAATQPTWGLMAASIAALLAIGAGGYLYDSRNDHQRDQTIASLDAEILQITKERVTERDALTRQVKDLETQLADATATRDEVRAKLADADDTIERLTAGKIELSSQLATVNNQVDASRLERDSLEQQVASLDADMRQLTEQAVVERDTLTRQLVSLQDRIGTMTAARDDLTERLADVEADLTAVTAARDAAASETERLETGIATLHSDLAAQARLVAERELSQQRIAALENDLSEAGRTTDELSLRVARLNQTNDLLLAETEDLRKQNSWIAQVLGYHRGYAGTPREVEVSAAEQSEKQALTKWFRATFGQSFTIPNLEGLTFIGGRIFFVNGVPTGQIAYHDQKGRLTGFCFTRGPNGQAIPVAEGRDDDLNIAYWLEDGWQYVLVGWEDHRQLTPLAVELQQSYGDNA